MALSGALYVTICHVGTRMCYHNIFDILCLGIKFEISSNMGQLLVLPFEEIVGINNNLSGKTWQKNSVLSGTISRTL